MVNLREIAMDISGLVSTTKAYGMDSRESLLDKIEFQILRVGNPKWGKRDPNLYDPAQLGKGIAVEREHTSSGRIAMEIAMDHLDEFPNYYEWHEWMEKALRTGLSMYDLHERLSALDHEQWMHWSKALARNAWLPHEVERRWKTMWVPYEDLPEEIKNSDREWADRAFRIMGLV